MTMDDHDHRILGPRLDLYHFDERAPGMVFWHSRGFVIYRALEEFVRSRMRVLGYEEVRTPQLLPREIWEMSGHWDKFAHGMFTLADGDRDMALKPMSCPCHLEIYKNDLRSWRELPMRLSEFGLCHRNESSGSMHGLMRTRAFEQDDAHVICREEDVRPEVAQFARLLDCIYHDLGFADYEVALSLRPTVRAGDDALWDWAESELLAAARECGFEPKIQPGEGAFYGPKLEFILKDRLGRRWQCGTIQLDGVLPRRLAATYITPDGSEAAPIMIHHAVLGSMGRFIALLLEHYEGALPFWFSPDQVAVAPVGPEQEAYANDVLASLRAAGIRARLFPPRETLSRRIVAAHDLFIPVVAVVGAREAASQTVALRGRAGHSEVALSDLAAAAVTAGQRPAIAPVG